MKVNKFAPTLSIYQPNRKTLLGVIPTPQALSINYRFSSFSTMNFEVSKKIYDERTENWIDNPIYNHIQKKNLIRTSTDNKVFKYKAEELLNDSDYSILSIAPSNRNVINNGVNCSLSYNTSCQNFTLQKETELYNLNAKNGYSWGTGRILYTYIGSDNEVKEQSSGFVRQHHIIEQAIVQESFIPVQVGDIIALACRDNSKNIDGSNIHYGGTPTFYYRLYFYSDSNSSSCTRVHPVLKWDDNVCKISNIPCDISTDSNTGNDAKNYNYDDADPLVRYRVKDGDFGSGIKSGYVRIAAISCRNDFKTEDKIIVPNNHVKIFSGERRCVEINTKQTKYNPEPFIKTTHSIPWWVINSVEETGEGINAKKSVTAYSYEYTLSNHNISLEDDTLPLFIPDTIVNKVSSSDFIIDCWRYDGKNCAQKGAQRMKRGIINQVLDNVPNWKIDYVSSDVITRWRTISDVSNTNIYSFLTNTVQDLYQCYIIFNTENLTINIINHSDIVGDENRSNLILSWRNALKSLQVTDTDDNFTTALRVNSADNTYGVNLVNPNGTNIIYNFNSVKDNLNYVVDEDHKDENGNPYTLKDCVDRYDIAIKDNLSNYRNSAKALISNTKKQVGYLSKISNIAADYRSVTDEVFSLQTGTKQKFPYIPFPRDDINGIGGKWYFRPNGGSTTNNCWVVSGVTETQLKYFRTVKGLVNDYWDAVEAYESCKKEVSDNLAKMKTIATKLSLNIKTLQKEFNNNKDNYTPIFTPKEALEMSNYIFEGDWTDECSVFNDEYSADDIYNTLVELYDNAKSDLDKFYSKPMYDFTTDTANILTNKEMSAVCENLYLGNIIRIYDDNKWTEPILLEVNLDYDNFDSSEISLSTYYNRKPKELRFCDLFNNMQQSSIQTPTYTFEN